MTKWTPARSSFGHIYPESTEEWSWLENPLLDPFRLLPGSNEWAVWRCKEHGHYHRARVSEKARHPRCGVCTGKIILVNFNDFTSQRPALIKYWDDLLNPITPEEIMGGSNKLVYWKCENGHPHSWLSSVKNFVRGRRCHYCSHHRVLPGFNDLATLFPELLREWDWSANGNLKPWQIMPSRREKVAWVCSMGHTWKAVPGSRTRRGDKCPDCSTRASQEETDFFNALKQTFPSLQHAVTLKVSGLYRSRAEVDMYMELGKQRFVIEYDGSYWHADSNEHDAVKSQALLRNGYSVLRVREQPLEPLAIEDSDYYNVGFEYKDIAGGVKATQKKLQLLCGS